MKALFLTGNSLRHKFFVNTLSSCFTDSYVISEVKNSLPSISAPNNTDTIAYHFYLRDFYERKFFETHDLFLTPCLPIKYKELSCDYIASFIKNYAPDCVFVSGASIIKEPVLSLLPTEKTFNLHLGLTPYYRGSGTNFWPFVNNELEFIGGSIIKIASGVDTGPVYVQYRPKFEPEDNVHTVGCKVIIEGVDLLKKMTNYTIKGKEFQSKEQVFMNDHKVYKEKDFTEHYLDVYRSNLEKGIVRNYLLSKGSIDPVNLIQLKIKQ